MIDSRPMVKQASVDVDSSFLVGAMEGTRAKPSAKQPDPDARRRLIVRHWNKLGRPSVGGQELSAIQEELGRRFGSNAASSPAAIARVLADQGAELRHPEVIECDALWRAETQAAGIGLPGRGEALTLEQAEELIERLEKLRSESGANDAQNIRAMAIEAREGAQLLARRRTLGESRRAEQLEIAEWLGVWIKTPNLFRDWLELRRRSPEFMKKFSKRDVTPQE